MSNLICLISDTHFGVRGDSPIFHKAFARFYQECLIPTLTKHGIKHIVHAGDVFDRRMSIDYNTLYQCREYFFEPLFKNSDFTMEVAVGNHDTYFKSTNAVNSPSLLLGEYSNSIKIYSEAQDGQHSPFFFIPWIHKNNAKQTFAAIQATQRTHAVGHLELSGFKMYKDSVAHGGVNHSFLKKFQQVYSGHFHHKSSQDNVMYLGATAEHTWSDFDDWRGFHIFDTETMKIVESIENPFKIFNRIVVDEGYEEPLRSEGEHVQIVHIEVTHGVDQKTVEAIRSSHENSGSQVTINDRTVVEPITVTLNDVKDPRKVIFDYVTTKVDDEETQRRVFERMIKWHSAAQEKGA